MMILQTSMMTIRMSMITEISMIIEMTISSDQIIVLKSNINCLFNPCVPDPLPNISLVPMESWVESENKADLIILCYQ